LAMQDEGKDMDKIRHHTNSMQHIIK
jgi:hypothetical protein